MCRQRHTNWSVANMKAIDKPREDVISKHAWNESEFPNFWDDDAIDAMIICGAKGDGVSDDTKALQYCLDNHHHVFLPKGRTHFFFFAGGIDYIIDSQSLQGKIISRG